MSHTQFLNRSLARSANVVNVLAAFGLSFIIVKGFSGVLGEIQHAGLVLVHDRPGLSLKMSLALLQGLFSAYRKVLVFTLIAGTLVVLLLIITGMDKVLVTCLRLLLS